MSAHVINRPWTDEDVELLQKVCEVHGRDLPKDPRQYIHWTEEEAKPVRDACKAQIDNLAPFLRDAKDRIGNRDFIDGQKRKYYTYAEFYRAFGGDVGLLHPIE